MLQVMSRLKFRCNIAFHGSNDCLQIQEPFDLGFVQPLCQASECTSQAWLLKFCAHPQPKQCGSSQQPAPLLCQHCLLLSSKLVAIFRECALLAEKLMLKPSDSADDKLQQLALLLTQKQLDVQKHYADLEHHRTSGITPDQLVCVATC